MSREAMIVLQMRHLEATLLNNFYPTTTDSDTMEIFAVKRGVVG